MTKLRFQFSTISNWQIGFCFFLYLLFGCLTTTLGNWGNIVTNLMLLCSLNLILSWRSLEHCKNIRFHRLLKVPVGFEMWAFRFDCNVYSPEIIWQLLNYKSKKKMIIIIKVKTCTSSKQLCIKEILNYVWTVCICMLCNKYTQFSLCFKYDYGFALLVQWVRVLHSES